MVKLLRLTALVYFLLVSNTLITAQQWTVTYEADIVTRGQRDIVPQNYITYQVDNDAIKEKLWKAPHESEVPIRESFTFLTIGLPDGTADVFRMVRYDMMESELASAHPDIRTFRGISVSDEYRYIRIDWTSNGMRAVIRDPDGHMYIDPYQRNDLRHRIAYYKKDFYRDGEWSCGVEGESLDIPEKPGARVGDCDFRSYRLAVATTGEYSNYFGATSSSQSALVLSEVVTAVNRQNDVYEFDFAVRFILINNNANVFYYSPGTDPFSGDACTQLNQNQTNMTNVIGGANYDIGHVFSVGSGGCAQLNALCSSTGKARGATGLNPPTGDPFYIDYVAHELGHQFGGNHTQNNACNRNASTAMEPGSASTIMGYAGICNPNVQSNSDPYFHGISLQEAANLIGSVSCHQIVSTANDPPVVSNVPNYTIPISTPFVLTASATDPNNDPLTYCWEQWDQEVGVMPPASTNTLGPMFRSVLPTNSPSRYFYNLPALTANTNPTWEELPSVARMMEFRVTVRDIHNGQYGCTDEDNTIITTVATAGPFVVTSQNTGASWAEGSEQTITWNVANTTASPVSCANVKISLSYDGGFTYPEVLLANTPNDGSAEVTIPAGTTAAGRIMVSAVGNIFFDINNQHITITPGLPNFTLSINPEQIDECNEGSVETVVSVGSFMGFSDVVNLTLLNAPPGASVTFIPSVVIPGGTSTLTISNIGNLFGTYMPVIRGNSSTGDIDVPFPVTLTTPAAAPALQLPANDAENVDLRTEFIWSPVTNATVYEYQVSENITFTPLTLSGTIATNQFLVSTLLTSDRTYYWRVRSNNICGNSAWSEVSKFKTMICQSANSTDVPVPISHGGMPTITSDLEILIDEEIIDMNVINLAGTHAYVDNLRFTLISPLGTEVVFWDRPCGDHDNFNIHFDDEAANSNWPCPPTNGLTYKPDATFNPFNGESSLGIWTLRVQDLQAQNGGSLNSWGLRVCHGQTCDLMVSVADGTGPGSLPFVIDCSGDGDTIWLSPDFAGKTIEIGGLPLAIDKDVTIVALGAHTTITGTGTRVFEIMPGNEVGFKDVYLKAATSMLGGALVNQGILTLENVVVEANPLVSGATLIQNVDGELKLIGDCRISQ